MRNSIQASAIGKHTICIVADTKQRDTSGNIIKATVNSRYVELYTSIHLERAKELVQLLISEQLTAPRGVLYSDVQSRVITNTLKRCDDWTVNSVTVNVISSERALALLGAFSDVAVSEYRFTSEQPTNKTREIKRDTTESKSERERRDLARMESDSRRMQWRGENVQWDSLCAPATSRDAKSTFRTPPIRAKLDLTRYEFSEFGHFYRSYRDRAQFNGAFGCSIGNGALSFEMALFRDVQPQSVLQHEVFGGDSLGWEFDKPRLFRVRHTPVLATVNPCDFGYSYSPVTYSRITQPVEVRRAFETVFRGEFSYSFECDVWDSEAAQDAKLFIAMQDEKQRAKLSEKAQKLANLTARIEKMDTSAQKFNAPRQRVKQFNDAIRAIESHCETPAETTRREMQIATANEFPVDVRSEKELAILRAKSKLESSKRHAKSLSKIRESLRVEASNVVKNFQRDTDAERKARNSQQTANREKSKKAAMSEIELAAFKARNAAVKRASRLAQKQALEAQAKASAAVEAPAVTSSEINRYSAIVE